MGFLDYIEKIQKKPEGTRKIILSASVAVIMAAIITIWAVNSFLAEKPKENPEGRGLINKFYYLEEKFKEAKKEIKEIYESRKP